MSHDQALDAQQVMAVRSGDREAFGLLVDRWFDRCWAVAWRILGDRELAADVAQDTLLAAWQQLDRLEQPGSFGGWVLRISRNRALDRLERERRAVPIGDQDALEAHGAGQELAGPEAAHARAEQRDLVWAAAAALGERDTSMLDLHLRHGLEPHELAEELGIAPNAAHQALFRMRNRLGAAVRAWLLWRQAHPACVVLRAELAATGGEDGFGAATVRVVNAHVKACPDCAQEHERVGSPAALFAAVPLALPPAALRARAVRALADAGVPVDASSGGAPGATEALPAAPGAPNDDPTDPMLPVPSPDRPEAALPRAGEHHDGRRRLVLVGLLLFGLVVAWGGWQGSRGGPDPTPVVAQEPTTEPRPSSSTPTAPPSPQATAGPSAEPSTATGVPPSASPERPEPTVGPSATATRSPEPTSAPTPTPTATAPAPRVLRFEAVAAGRCPTDRLQEAYELAWASQHADTATLTDPDGASEPVEPSGSAQRCVPADLVPRWVLEVEGAGGAASRSVTADSP